MSRVAAGLMVTCECRRDCERIWRMIRLIGRAGKLQDSILI